MITLIKCYFEDFTLNISHDFTDIDDIQWNGFLQSVKPIQQNVSDDFGGIVELSSGELVISNEAFTEITQFPAPTKGYIEIYKDDTSELLLEANIYLKKYDEFDTTFDVYNPYDANNLLLERELYDGSIGVLPLAFGEVLNGSAQRLPDVSSAPTYWKASIEGTLAKAIVAVTDGGSGTLNFNVLSHGWSAGNTIYVEGTDTATADYNGTYSIDSIVDTDNFKVVGTYTADVSQGHVYRSGYWRVYDNGVPIPGNVTDNGDGTFSLSATPTGEVTISGTSAYNSTLLYKITKYMVYKLSGTDDGLIDKWSCDNTDFSYSGLRDLILSSTTSYTNGIVNKCLYYDGSAYSTVSSSDILSGVKTIAVRFNPIAEVSRSGEAWKCIATDYTYPTKFGISINYNVTPNQIIAAFRDSLGNSSTVISSISTYSKWYSIVLVFDDLKANLYIDGVYIGSGSTITNNTGHGTYGLSVGGNSALTRASISKIEDIRIYDRVLTQPEITNFTRYTLDTTNASTIPLNHYQDSQIQVTDLMKSLYKYCRCYLKKNFPSASYDWELFDMDAFSGNYIVDEYGLFETQYDTKEPAKSLISNFTKREAVNDDTGRHIEDTEIDVTYIGTDAISYGKDYTVQTFNDNSDATYTQLEDIWNIAIQPIYSFESYVDYFSSLPVIGAAFQITDNSLPESQTYTIISRGIKYDLDQNGIKIDGDVQ